MKAELFVAIADRLKQKLPELAWIDWDWGQLELPAENYPVQFDCCLISFPDGQWKTEGKNVQYGNQMIQVRTAVDVYSDTHVAGGVTAPDRNYALNKLKLESRVYAALQGFSGNFFTPLARVSSGEEKRDDGLKVFVATFLTGAVDDSAAKPMQEVQAGLNLQAERVAEIS